MLLRRRHFQNVTHQSHRSARPVYLSQPRKSFNARPIIFGPLVLPTPLVTDTTPCASLKYEPRAQPSPPIRAWTCGEPFHARGPTYTKTHTRPREHESYNPPPYAQQSLGTPWFAGSRQKSPSGHLVIFVGVSDGRDGFGSVDHCRSSHGHNTVRSVFQSEGCPCKRKRILYYIRNMLRVRYTRAAECETVARRCRKRVWRHQ